MKVPAFLGRWVSPRWPFLLGIGLSVIGTFALLGGSQSSGPQPIAFNHARHVANGLACSDCHGGAQTQAHATLPTLATCMSCHESALTPSKEEEKIRTLAAAGKEFDWVQVTRVPSHVYFSHRQHVTISRLECAACHGPMERASTPPRQPFRAMTMATCISCHQKNRARTDCNDCHR